MSFWGGSLTPHWRKEREPDGDADDASIPAGLTGAALREFVDRREAKKTDKQKLQEFARHLNFVQASKNAVLEIYDVTVEFDSTPDKQYLFEIQMSDLTPGVKQNVESFADKTRATLSEDTTLALAAEIQRQLKG